MEKKRGLKKEDCQKSPAMVRKWKKKTCEREKERERERWAARSLINVCNAFLKEGRKKRPHGSFFFF